MHANKAPLHITIIVLLATAPAVGCSETVQGNYADMNAARQSQMIDKGWIPSYLPADARNISFSGDLDAVFVYGTFTSGDPAGLDRSCTRADDSLRIPGYGPDWFRNTVKEGDTAAAIRPGRFDVLQCQDKFDIVISRSQQFRLYWSVRK